MSDNEEIKSEIERLLAMRTRGKQKSNPLNKINYREKEIERLIEDLETVEHGERNIALRKIDQRNTKRAFWNSQRRRTKNRQAISNTYAELNRTRRSRIVNKNYFIGIKNIDELKILFYDKFIHLTTTDFNGKLNKIRTMNKSMKKNKTS